MVNLRKAAEMALEALETLMIEKGSVYDKSIQALRQALAQPKRKWVGLTDDEFKQFSFHAPWEVVQEIEAKLREKNS